MLRGALGLVALIQGAFCVMDGTHSTMGTWLCGLLGLAAGGSLLAGFMTPIAGVIVGLGVLGMGFSLLPAPSSNLLDARLSAIFAGIISAAIVVLGPGAFSLDARLFGRREIIIPPPHRRPEP